MRGILAIWNDCARGREPAYEEWYQDEHLIERLAVSGFCVGRRYEAIVAARQFLTTYEVERPGVLTSAEYLERLAHPTERTTAIMRSGFSNMCRTVCERHSVLGAIRGGVAVTLALSEPNPLVRLSNAAENHALGIELAHSEIWISAEKEQGKVSAEEQLRGRDRKISGCLALEFLRQEPALRAADDLRRACLGAEVGVYRLLCTLRREDLA
jgi:hypothetical protein